MSRKTTGPTFPTWFWVVGPWLLVGGFSTILGGPSCLSRASGATHSGADDYHDRLLRLSLCGIGRFLVSGGTADTLFFCLGDSLNIHLPHLSDTVIGCARRVVKAFQSQFIIAVLQLLAGFFVSFGNDLFIEASLFRY